MKGTSMISVRALCGKQAHIILFRYAPDVRRSYAIRPGAIGDIAVEESIAWMREEAPSLFDAGHLSNQLLTYSTQGRDYGSYNALTGATLYQQRLGVGAPASASMVAADGVVYAANEDGGGLRLKPGAKYEQVAMNPMGETVMATPAITNGTLFIRGARRLFAVRR